MRAFFEKIIDILFPKEITVLELEKIPSDELIFRLSKPKQSANTTPALFSYQDKKVKVLIAEIKRHENKILIEKVAEMMCEKILESFEDDLQFGMQKISLVPVPSSVHRVRERGYNPAELIAQKIVKHRPDIFEYAPILKKIRETKRQTNLPRSERLTNLVGAFEATPTNAPVIIIDDVSTTGATLAEAKRALHERNVFIHHSFVIAK
ncbi:MAG: hypothetical protein WA051_02205 [Minisyncoccia bacterium]